MKTLSLRKQAALAPKYVLFIDGAGYLASEQELSGINFSDDVNGARQFSVGFDDPNQKEGIWSATARRFFNNPEIKFEIIYL